MEEIEKGLLVERLAQAIHAACVSEVTRSATSSIPPYAVPWDDLEELFRESNRNQARQIIELLETAGFGIMNASDLNGLDSGFTHSQIELFAKMEHDRWTEEKMRLGWVCGAVRDHEKKVHPDMVPWDCLSNEAKEKDRNAVRTFPALLAYAGYAIHPTL